LRHLAGFGLVQDSNVGDDARKRYWEATAPGFRFELGDGDEGRAASQVLSRAMFEQYADLPMRWARDVEPHLDDTWRREAGLANTGVHVTADELAGIEESIEQLLAPYVTRPEADRPDGAQVVRLLRYVLPGLEA
jgi:hypothetical protein